ncbi:MAG: ATP-dependent DNA helicase RecQ [Anaeromyxobacter sp.]
MSDETQDRRALDEEIAALGQDWRGGDRTSEARRSCLERLTALRARWRARPALFTPASIDLLRALARELEATPPRREQASLPLGAPPAIPPGEAAERAREVLRATFGHAAWRPGQAPIVEAVLKGRDCVGVMPTGAGKSLTYQIPARLLGGTTLVISPLIALMKDQVDAMSRVGLRAAFLNSSLAPEERRDRVRALRRGELELLYAAPEGLEASVGSALEGVKLSLLAVDEAHCISAWGHDFRPAYRNLAGLRERFGAPVLALTATATPEVVRDIARQLAMKDPLVVKGSFLRKNLRIHAMKKGEGVTAREAILRIVRARRGESGIVYALSRKSTEEIATMLRGHRIRAEAYHAGLEPEQRARVQDAFQAGALDVVVATVAFGMGIDKPDIRYVVHRDLPRTIEAYYQEIGRAGRDGKPSDVVMLYSWADVMSWERLLDGEDAEVAGWQRAQVRAMFRLAEGEGCRHAALVGHFGEDAEPCGDACDRCTGAEIMASAPPVPGKGRSRSRRSSSPAHPERRAREAGPETRDVQGDPDAADLFEALRAWRSTTARAKGVPAYVVFPDATLAAIAEARPRDLDALGEISGVGPKKLAEHGEAVLGLVKQA